jgi:hypothetical protein
MTQSGGELSLHEPAAYRIQVQGPLDAGWSSRLGGMAVRSATTPEQGLVTTLEGVLLDQAALVGVLSALNLLGLPVISVQHLPAKR